MDKVIFFFFVAVLLVAVGFVIKFWKQIGDFIADVRTEMTKVSWPTQQEVINGTTVVFSMTIILTIVVWVVDLVLGKGMSALLKIFM